MRLGTRWICRIFVIPAALLAPFVVHATSNPATEWPTPVHTSDSAVGGVPYDLRAQRAAAGHFPLARILPVQPASGLATARHTQEADAATVLAELHGSGAGDAAAGTIARGRDNAKTSGPWGPDIVVRGERPDSRTLCVEAFTAECLARAGLSEPTIAFLLAHHAAAEGPTPVPVGFVENGPVDLVIADIGSASGPQELFINGVPEIQYPSYPPYRIDAYDGAVVGGLQARHPEISAWMTKVPGHRQLPDGDQRYSLTRHFTDSCRACRTVAIAVAHAEFDPAGRETGERVIGVLDASDLPREFRLSADLLSQHPKLVDYALAIRGYPVAGIDSTSRDANRAALREFQREAGLEVTGTADAATRTALANPDTLMRNGHSGAPAARNGQSDLFGPRAVVDENRRAALACADHHRHDRQALSLCLRAAGQSSKVIDFATHFQADPKVRRPVLLSEFRDLGSVDFAEVLVPQTAPSRVYGLVTEGTRFSSAETLLDFSQADDAPSQALRARFPNARPAGSGRVIGHRYLDNGGQRFALSDMIIEACANCPARAYSIGYIDFTANGAFAERAVIGWVRAHSGTWPEIADIRRRLYRSDVETVQMLLNGAGYIAGSMDGIYDDATAAALSAFRRDTCLGEDATWTQETADLLLQVVRHHGLDPIPAACAPGLPNADAHEEAVATHGTSFESPLPSRDPVYEGALEDRIAGSVDNCDDSEEPWRQCWMREGAPDDVIALGALLQDEGHDGGPGVVPRYYDFGPVDVALVNFPNADEERAVGDHHPMVNGEQTFVWPWPGVNRSLGERLYSGARPKFVGYRDLPDGGQRFVYEHNVYAKSSQPGVNAGTAYTFFDFIDGRLAEMTTLNGRPERGLRAAVPNEDRISLVRRGYNPGAWDTRSNVKIQGAIDAFQSEYCLPQSGEMDWATRQVLNDHPQYFADDHALEDPCDPDVMAERILDPEQHARDSEAAFTQALDAQLVSEAAWPNTADLFRYDRGRTIAELSEGHLIELTVNSVDFENGRGMITEFQEWTEPYAPYADVQENFSWSAFYKAVNNPRFYHGYFIKCRIPPAVLRGLAEDESLVVRAVMVDFSDPEIILDCTPQETDHGTPATADDPPSNDDAPDAPPRPAAAPDEIPLREGHYVAGGASCEVDGTLALTPDRRLFSQGVMHTSQKQCAFRDTAREGDLFKVDVQCRADEFIWQTMLVLESVSPDSFVVRAANGQPRAFSHCPDRHSASPPPQPESGSQPDAPSASIAPPLTTSWSTQEILAARESADATPGDAPDSGTPDADTDEAVSDLPENAQMQEPPAIFTDGQVAEIRMFLRSAQITGDAADALSDGALSQASRRYGVSWWEVFGAALAADDVITAIKDEAYESALLMTASHAGIEVLKANPTLHQLLGAGSVAQLAALPISIPLLDFANFMSDAAVSYQIEAYRAARDAGMTHDRILQGRNQYSPNVITFGARGQFENVATPQTEGRIQISKTPLASISIEDVFTVAKQLYEIDQIRDNGSGAREQALRAFLGEIER